MSAKKVLTKNETPRSIKHLKYVCVNKVQILSYIHLKERFIFVYTY